MSPSIPTVTIEVSSQDRLIVTLSKTREDGTTETLPPFETHLTPQQLNEQREVFYRGLDAFLDGVRAAKKVEDFDGLSMAMLSLHTLGRGMNEELFGPDRYEVEDFFRSACPAWRLSESDNYVPPRVEIRTRIEHSIPFEFFPIFDTNEDTLPNHIHDTDELISLATRFLGFSTIVYRLSLRRSQVLPSLAISEAQLENARGLCVRLFQHAGLPGAARERVFFETQENQTRSIQLRGPWPNTETSQFVSELAAQLWNASPSSTGDTLQSLDQIQHFACHCDTSSSTSSEYFLTLAHKEENDGTPSYREGHVAMNQLKEQFGGFRKRVSKKPLPLIFLNACGSSKMTPAGMASFPKFFLEYILGNRGVIGSEAIIPDVVAAEFSERFYRNLIRGHCLGEAMYRARWRLVRYLNNPLGILYAIYANPDLHVQITRAS